MQALCDLNSCFEFLETHFVSLFQVFLDAPIPATGPAQPDVTPFFKGPYYEWWNAQVWAADVSTQVLDPLRVIPVLGCHVES